MTIPAPVDGFYLETLDDEIVLLHPHQNIMIYSNQIGALIWRLCDGHRSVDQIVEILGEAYPEDADQIRVDVTTFIQSLISRGALEEK